MTYVYQNSTLESMENLICPNPYILVYICNISNQPFIKIPVEDVTITKSKVCHNILHHANFYIYFF